MSETRTNARKRMRKREKVVRIMQQVRRRVSVLVSSGSVLVNGVGGYETKMDFSFQFIVLVIYT